MTRRYLVTVAALVDADPEKVQGKITHFTRRITGITHLPLSTNVTLLPTAEELSKMSKSEIRKWQEKIQKAF